MFPSVFFFQAEDGIRDVAVTGVQTCALPIYGGYRASSYLHSRTFRQSLLNGVAQSDVRVTRAFVFHIAKAGRSEERRVGEEGRSRGSPDHLKKKKKTSVEWTKWWKEGTV